MLPPAMRVLHTSDWHLGRSLGAVSLVDAQRRFLDFVVDLLVREPHDLLVVAGDVYDRSVPPEAAVELWTRFLADLRRRAPTVPLVAIAGNHDNAIRLATASSVLVELGLHLCGDAESVDRPRRLTTAAGQTVDVYAVPFLWPGALDRHRDPETRIGSTQVSAMTEAMGRISAVRDPSVVNLAIAHCFALGGTVTDSERTLVGQATQVDAALFADFDYTALGHLHRAQRVGPKVHYSGSPIAYSFSEATDAKVVLSVEVARGRAPKVRAIPVPDQRPLAVIRGRLHDLLTDPAYASAEVAYVRAELVDEVPQPAPMDQLRRRFPFVLEAPWSRPGTVSRATPFRARDEGAARLSLDDEFRAFEARIGRDLAAEPDVARAFDLLRADAEAEPR